VVRRRHDQALPRCRSLRSTVSEPLSQWAEGRRANPDNTSQNPRTAVHGRDVLATAPAGCRRSGYRAPPLSSTPGCSPGGGRVGARRPRPARSNRAIRGEDSPIKCGCLRWMGYLEGGPVRFAVCGWRLAGGRPEAGWAVTQHPPPTKTTASSWLFQPPPPSAR
jgi:hypothetical protein